MVVLLFLLVPLGGDEEPNGASPTGVTASKGASGAVDPLVGRWEANAGGLVQLTVEGNGDILLTVERSNDCSTPGFASIQGTGEFRTREGRDQLVLPDLTLDCRLGSDGTIPGPTVLERDPVADQVIVPADPDAPALDRVEEFTVNPLAGTWEIDDLRLTIDQDGTIRLTDDSSVACSPPGLIVVDEVGRFRTRRGVDQLVVSDAFVDCRQGSGDVTIPELIVEHEPDTDRVRTGGGPFTGIAFERV